MALMTADERVKALEALEERQLHLQKRAAQSAWTSVVVAAVVLVALIAFAYSQLAAVRRETASLTDQKATLAKDIETLGRQKQAAEEEKKVAERQTAAVVGALSQVPEAQRKEAVARHLSTSPQSAALLPRIYMQTVSRDDDARAQAVQKALTNAGYLVLGIENVPKALPLLTRSDVRFYHSVERAEAEKIAAVMKSAGESQVGVIYLKQFENSTTVRPNHFEVWLVHGGGT